MPGRRFVCFTLSSACHHEQNSKKDDWFSSPLFHSIVPFAVKKLVNKKSLHACAQEKNESSMLKESATARFSMTCEHPRLMRQ